MKLDDFRVELINPEEVKQFVEMHGRMACICYDTNEKFAERVGKNVVKSGHLSGSRGLTFKFKLTNIPRACIDQIVRHNVGFYPQVQSQRYVKVDDMNVYVPPIADRDDSLKELIYFHSEYTKDIYNAIIERLAQIGYHGEKANEIARGVLPMNIESACTIAVTLEGMINFAHKRLCVCSQEHIRRVCKLMVAEIIKVEPIYKDSLVAICEHLLWCPESKNRTCGLYPQKDDLLKLLNNNREALRNE